MSSFGLAEHFAPHDELLLVAARECVRGDVDAGRADVEVIDDLLGALHAPRRSIQRAIRIRRLALMTEHAVLPQRRRQQQPVMLTVFGDVADAVLAT